jgi:Ca2+-binding EF-hand superfamily protein
MATEKEKQYSAAELRQIFDKYDLNKSNSLSFEEVKRLCHEAFGKEYEVESIVQIFKEIDKNKDQLLTFEEFLAWWRVGRGASYNSEMIKNYLLMLDGVKTYDEAIDSINSKMGDSK